MTANDPRLHDDVHTRCPVALSGLSTVPGVPGARWVRKALNVTDYLEAGGQLCDVVAGASELLTSAVLLIRRERMQVDARRMDDARGDR